MNTCPTCGQTLPPSPPAVRLTRSEHKLVMLVLQAGKHGIASDRLRELFYADRPDGGPPSSVIYVLVYSANKKLRREHMKIHSRQHGQRPCTYWLGQID